jgi:hypothetical protein
MVVVVDGGGNVSKRSSGLVKCFINKRVIAADVNKRVLSKNIRSARFIHISRIDPPRLARVLHRAQC